MKLLIKQSAGALHTLTDVDATLSVAALKALLSEPPFSVPVEQQRLVYKGHVMKDNSTLADYGTCAACVAHLFVLGTFF
jgi:ubiquilin